MSEFLQYLDDWRRSKRKIFSSENYAVTISDTSDYSKESRFLDIESPKIIARATVWSSGELDVEAVDRNDGTDIIRRTFSVESSTQLDDKLNWWLSEIAVY